MPGVHGDVPVMATEEVERCLAWSRRGKATRPSTVVRLCESILAGKGKPKKKKSIFKNKEEDTDAEG